MIADDYDYSYDFWITVHLLDDIDKECYLPIFG